MLLVLAVLLALAARVEAAPEAGASADDDVAAAVLGEEDLDALRGELVAMQGDDEGDLEAMSGGPAGLDHGATDDGATDAGAFDDAGGIEAREARLRARPSPIGRIDVALTWRRVVTDTRSTHEVWLLGTWRL